MLLKIRKYGDPVLETPCDPVTEFGTDELNQLVDNMFETMYANKGVGLAAPQVGVGKKLMIIDPSAGQDPEAKIVLVNPELVKVEGKQVGEEGCLSIPGFREDVRRAMKVRVRARTPQGEEVELEGEELLARAIQHENDHLNGILFLKHLSPLKRDMIRRKIRKLQQSGEWD
jgi:peptide deformylase